MGDLILFFSMQGGKIIMDMIGFFADVYKEENWTVYANCFDDVNIYREGVLQDNVNAVVGLLGDDMEYSNRKKKTKREEFLDAMEKIIPWAYWVDMIHPYYFNNKRGRRLIGIEDSIYDSHAMRSFIHIDFNEQ